MNRRRSRALAIGVVLASVAASVPNAAGQDDPWAVTPPAADPWATTPSAGDLGAHGGTFVEGSNLQTSARGLMSPDDLRAYVAATRDLAAAKVLERVQARHDAIMETVATLLMTLSLSGLLLLLLPLFLRRKYPGRGRTLLKYSVVAAATFILAVNLFTMTLLLLRVFQGGVGGQLNPQVAIVAAIFDTLDSHADKYAAFATTVFGPVIEQLSAGETSAAVLLLERGQRLSVELQAFEPVAVLMRGLHAIFDLVPLLLIGISLLLFAVAAGPVLLEIVRLPARAASGEARAGRRVLGATVRRVGAELVATLCLIVVLLVVSLVLAIFLQLVLGAAIESFLDYFLIALLYVQAVEGPSSALIVIALGSNAVFLGLILVTVLAGAALFLAKAHRIFQQRFHLERSLRSHAFWKRGMLSLLWCVALPALYAMVAGALIAAINDGLIGDGAAPSWGALFVIGPVLLVVGYPLILWWGRGGRSLRFLFTSLFRRRPIEG